MDEKITITVYGADEICASCINAPPSKDTFEWLQAAIGRRYNHPAITYEYIDINNPPESAEHRSFAARVRNDEFFYPVILINGKVIEEGNPRLKKVFKSLEETGMKQSQK